jgi:O-succinylbenzoate synthase
VKIERIRVIEVDIPLRFPFETSFGRWTSRQGLLVLADGDGLTGYGEVTAHETPFYSYETLAGAGQVLRDHLAPAVLRAPIATPDEIAPRLAFVRGHPMAKAGLEGAVRDLLARRDGVSLAAQIGGTRDRVDAGVSLGVEPSPEDLVRRVEPFVAAGYRRVKVKIRPGWDEAPVAAVREAFPTLPLAADANAAYTLKDADDLARLDPHRLVMLEQPLAWDDLVDHAALTRRLTTPICLDESLTKLGRVGGMTEARAIHDRARSAGVPVWCGGMLETCIGRLHNLALASLPGFVMPGDLSGTDRYFEVDLVDPPIRVDEEGQLEVPDGPGIGRIVIPEAVSRVTVGEEVIVATGGDAGS